MSRLARAQPLASTQQLDLFATAAPTVVAIAPAAPTAVPAPLDPNPSISPIVTTVSAPPTPVPAPSLLQHPQANRRVRLGNVDIDYQLLRVKRRSIGFVVGADGLVVRAPRWVSLAQIEAALAEKGPWITRKLVDLRERQSRLEAARISWREGATLPYLGQDLVLVLDPRQSAAGAVLGPSAVTEALPGLAQQTLHLGLAQTASPAQIRDATQAWLMRQARALFMQRLDFYAPQLGVRWQKLKLSSATTRWGSASANGVIALNWRLIHFRLAVIDYVVAHELSHLRVMDHSPRFWDTVRQLVPDYQRLRGELQDDTLPVWT